MVIAEEKRTNKVVSSTINCLRYYTYLISHQPKLHVTIISIFFKNGTDNFLLRKTNS